jgi:hypothetical protein
LIESNFNTFNITYISREINQLVGSLAIVSITFKVPQKVQASYEIQIKHRPSILDNIKHWQVFEDDQEIKIFMECVEEFVDIQVDQEEDIVETAKKKSFQNTFAGQKIMELKTNRIPKGLVPLEKLFDKNYLYLKSNNKVDTGSIMDCKMGIKGDPKMVKISKSLSEEERKRYV